MLRLLFLRLGIPRAPATRLGLEVSSAKMGGSVIISAVVLMRSTRLTLGDWTDRLECSQSGSKGVTYNELRDQNLMLGVSVAPELMLTAESLRIVIALTTIDFRVLWALVWLPVYGLLSVFLAASSSTMVWSLVVLVLVLRTRLWFDRGLASSCLNLTHENLFGAQRSV